MKACWLRNTSKKPIQSLSRKKYNFIYRWQIKLCQLGLCNFEPTDIFLGLQMVFNKIYLCQKQEVGCGNSTHDVYLKSSQFKSNLSFLSVNTMSGWTKTIMYWHPVAK
jgi:hypothetical protein